MKRLSVIAAALVLAFPVATMAQSGTNSPYSQYGLGVLSDQAGGANRGMNGLALGLREHNQLNYLNPASYSALDSLTFIFDVGMSGQITNFKEGFTRVNANNGNLEYVTAGFRLFKHVGLSFGLLPFSNVGYEYSSSEYINGKGTSDATYYTNTYSGSGGLHQVYLGIGWELFKGFSVGVNGSYLWGDYTRTVTNAYSDGYINTLTKKYTGEVRSYKLDFGAQYTQKLSKDNSLTLGLSYSFGHKLHGNPQCDVISQNSQTSVTDTTSYKVRDGLELPSSYGVGLMFCHKDKWKVGADYTLQQWSKVSYPVYKTSGDNAAYALSDGMFADLHKVTLGGEICPNSRSRRFLSRVHYRLGASYASNYLKINGLDGPKEWSVSAGFGIPITNSYNNRSLLNISAQWVNRSSKQFVTENSFRLNIGITFNERWFAKWKME